MEGMSTEELAEHIARNLAEKFAVPAPGCAQCYPPEHREFVAAFIQELADKRARRKEIADKVAGSVIAASSLAFLGFLGGLVLDWFFKRGGH